MKSSSVLIFLVILAALALFFFVRSFTFATEQDALKFFKEDLDYNYPDADIKEIVSIQKTSDGSDSYVLKAWVTKNFFTPCPEKIEVEYGYPSRNFIGSATKLVYGCVVCLEDKKNCHIIYPEEAIIASHTYPNTSKVKEFLENYPNAKPSVKLLEEFDGYKNVWFINWSTPENSLSVYINQADNSIIKIE
jgi:hypothetical protein